MAGYNYIEGMSNNAVRAYNDGLKPLSKITSQDLRDAGLNITKSFARWLAENDYWKSSEWHHSGGTWYNKVEFYDPSELSEAISSGDIDIDSLLNIYRSRSTQTKQESGKRRVSGSYKLWGGTRKHPTVVGEQNFTGTKLGDWIHLDSGGKNRASGNHISWYYVDKV